MVGVALLVHGGWPALLYPATGSLAQPRKIVQNLHWHLHIGVCIGTGIGIGIGTGIGIGIGIGIASGIRFQAQRGLKGYFHRTRAPMTTTTLRCEENHVTSTSKANRQIEANIFIQRSFFHP